MRGWGRADMLEAGRAGGVRRGRGESESRAHDPRRGGARPAAPVRAAWRRGTLCRGIRAQFQTGDRLEAPGWWVVVGLWPRRPLARDSSNIKAGENGAAVSREGGPRPEPHDGSGESHDSLRGRTATRRPGFRSAGVGTSCPIRPGSGQATVYRPGRRDGPAADAAHRSTPTCRTRQTMGRGHGTCVHGARRTASRGARTAFGPLCPPLLLLISLH
jgi:hypothetical protein